jgi:hypothetical protein
MASEQGAARAAVVAVGLVRIGAGISLGGSPSAFLRWERGIPSGSSMVLLMRTVGIRDLAIGLGTAAALRSGSPSDARRWVAAGLVSDGLDVGAGLWSARTATGLRGVISALVAAPMVVLDLWTLKLLREQRRTA